MLNIKLLTMLNEILEEANNNPITELNPLLNLKEDLNMDSLMLAEFTVRVEDEFDIDIFEDGIVQTMGEVLNKLEER